MYYLIVISLALICVNGEPSVKIPDGSIQGTVATSYSGRIYSQFIGIPYAKPPVGDLRFEDPVPSEAWEGTWFANKSTVCVQFIVGVPQIGEEDCLHLSVYVAGSDIKPEANLDVIVNIHGGAFMLGSGNDVGPKYLMDNDVIFVTLNYRLGVFGFLSTGDERLPGNLGMKDQVLALKWVKNNIRHFGGNPESVTLTGMSAGGASVHYHLLSPLSKGLYHRAIAMSGSALNAWTFQEKARDKAMMIGEAVGCSQMSTEDLVKCLKSRTSGQLHDATRVLYRYESNPFSPVAVVVDSASENPFLPQHPYDLLMKGEVNDVPYLTSATADEGLCPGATFLKSPSYFEKLNRDWNEVAPEILHYADAVSRDNIDEVSQKIREFYLGGKEISRETFKHLVQMIGDRLFLADLELAARLHSKAVKSPVYFYHFNYTAEEVPSLTLFFTGTNERFGVSHGDDMMYLLSNTFVKTPPKLTAKDEKMMQTMVAIWTSFAHSGKPNIPDWKAVSKDSDDPFDYLYIQHGSEMRQAQELGFRSFWESLPFEENANLRKSSPARTEL